MGNTKETKLIRVEIKETEFTVVVNCSSEVVRGTSCGELSCREVVRVVFTW